MDSYNFTYRRISDTCLHCSKLKERSIFKRTVDALFRKKTIKKDAKENCELEWKSLEVIGHGPENYTETISQDIDGKKMFKTVDSQNRGRMVLYFKDGSLKTISGWLDCELRLDTDWVLFTKCKMEKESGQDVKLAVETR